MATRATPSTPPFGIPPCTAWGPEAGITRRDPTTVLKLGETYYVWYTRRATAKDRNPRNRPPYQEQNWEEPVYDWDLAEIWLATSSDGFDWQEQGRAVAPGPRDEFDGRSVFTPDILLWRGKYYLYYQAVGHPYTNRTRNVIGMSWAERPEGPWRRCPQPVLEPGAAGEWAGEGDSDNVRRYGAWDSHKVHDPFALVREGRIWLYYKGQPMGWGTRYSAGIGWGVAMADEPAGPLREIPPQPGNQQRARDLPLPLWRRGGGNLWARWPGKRQRPICRRRVEF